MVIAGEIEPNGLFYVMNTKGEFAHIRLRDGVVTEVTGTPIADLSLFPLQTMEQRIYDMNDFDYRPGEGFFVKTTPVAPTREAPPAPPPPPALVPPVVPLTEEVIAAKSAIGKKAITKARNKAANVAPDNA